MIDTAPDRSALIEHLLEVMGVGDSDSRKVIARSFYNEEPAARPGKANNLRARQERSERLVKALMAKMEMLACALGACPSCWGADRDCSDCGGAGAPGALLPDPQCFKTFVVPVLRRMKKEYRNGELILPDDPAPGSFVAPDNRPKRENQDHE